jgi:hypothetical protein
MAFLDSFKSLFVKSKEEKEKEANKIKLLANIKHMVEVADYFLEKLKNESKNILDEGLKLRTNKVIEKFENVKHHLDDAYSFLDALNIEFTLDELKEASRNINFDDLSSHIDVLIKTRRLQKTDNEKILFIRTNIAMIIKNLPSFELE